MKRGRGFTLIELLVAITILAIVAVLGWRGLDSIVRARTSLNADLDQTRGLQLAFAQMQSDASQIADRQYLNQREVLAAQDGRVIMVRNVFAENQPSRVQVVTYSVRNGVLTRRESLPTRNLTELDTAWSAMVSDSDSEGVAPVTLTSGVDSMAIRLYYDVTQGGQGWVVPGAAAPVATPQAPQSSQAPQTPATTPTPNSPQALAASGLEVSLQLTGQPNKLVKIFLLGAT